MHFRVLQHYKSYIVFEFSLKDFVKDSKRKKAPLSAYICTWAKYFLWYLLNGCGGKGVFVCLSVGVYYGF